MSLDLPASIQEHRQTREDGAESFARSIRKAIKSAYRKIEPETLDKHSGVDSDDMSEAMVPFVNDIKRLQELSHPKALQLAYNCVLYLGRHSYADLEMCGTAGSGHRPSDEPADELLVSIIRKRREHAEAWDWGQDLAELEDRFEELYEYGVETWFPKSIELLQRWKKRETRASRR